VKAITALLLLGLLAAAERQTQRRPPGVTLEVLRQMAQPAGAEPIEVLNVEKGWGGADALMPLTQSEAAAVRNAAVRAIGRLEDPRLVLPLLSLKNISMPARSDALAQSLKGFNPSVDPSLVQTALEWLHLTASRPLEAKTIPDIAPVLLPLGRIAYATPEQMHKAEEMLLRITVFARPDLRLGTFYVTGLRAIESLARVNTRLSGLDAETIAQLEKAVEKQSVNDSPAARFLALAALINGRGLTGDTAKVALKDDDREVRRLAMTVLGGGGAGLDDATRLRLIEEGLEDKSANVRYEAVRAYSRRGAPTNGCGPILDRVGDPDPHVSLAALDALGDLCKEDEAVTTRLMAETRVPPTVGSWHRDTHAFVALAKRAPEKAAVSMEVFVTHPVWWVRMYATGAAAVAGDLIHLEKLAYDANDNVREAAIEPLRRLKKADAEPAIIAALERTDVQLLRTAARLLKESPPNHALFRPLMTALMRLTKEGKETSRDARLALLEAIAMHASRDEATELQPLLRDFDPKIAEQAAQIIIQRTGKVALPAALPPTRGWPQEFANLRQCVVVDLASGGSFRMTMQPASAPVTVDRFLKLATKDRYYDGLTFHRVVPNFVIQGGSPGANEYAGHKEYMRDEVGGNNVRGSVGLSTRGRNTGDAQFYINMVDNLRLNYDYTVFASVMAEDMDAVDRILEGDVMRSITLSKCPVPK
jgi:cyclophilin family peptidyl-prolyl cis-trans isomerase